MTLPEKQVLKSKICCSCKKEKELSSFYVNRYIKTGYEARCKICKKGNLKCRKPNGEGRVSSGRPVNRETPQLFNVRKEDWIETFEFLKSIGYDLSSDKTIHEQFCIKHNLKPRKRMYEKSIQYTPQDLGMI